MTADRLQAAALSVLRIVVGFTFSLHGMQKILGMFGGVDNQGHRATAALLLTAGLIELLGGLMILLGLFTRPVAFICSGEMAVAYFMVPFHRGFWPVQNGGDPAVIYCFVFLFLAATGGGAWSLDQLMPGRRSEVQK